MNPAETLELAEQIKSLHALGLTILLIEHKLDVVTRLADKVVVLDHGEKIAEGTPDEVRRNEQVLQAYLGRGSWRRQSTPMTDAPLLRFDSVNTHYGDLHVLKDVNYTIGDGEIVSLLGGNACGKSTTMKTIMGVVRPTTGRSCSTAQPIERLSTAERVRRGIAPVLEARRLFPRMTVFENLEMGAYTRKRGPEFDEDLERVYQLFPRVKERRTPARRHAVRRRAADGGDRPSADGAAAADLHGRAVDGPLAALCRAGVRHHPGDQPAGHDDLHGRAERQHGACRSPTAPTCCRPAGWCCPAPPPNCAGTRRSAKPISANCRCPEAAKASLVLMRSPTTLYLFARRVI